MTKDTYRPHFCNPAFYHKHLPQFQFIQNRIAHLPPIDQITLWVICCACLRRPQSWYAGLQNELKTIVPAHFISDLFSELGISWPQKLPKNIDLKEFCRCVRIAPLPQASLKALFYFYTQQYPLEILCYEPNPLELLKIQITGKRVLTFENDFQKWPLLKYGERDVLSFWIHDLIHAEHFFSHPQNLRGQIGFYRFIYEILLNKVLDSILVSPEFNDSFSYLISDMNSHPIHLIKTLKAHIQIHEKALSLKNSPWIQIENMPIISSNLEVKNILHRINTSAFSTGDALKLTAFFELDLYQLTLS